MFSFSQEIKELLRHAPAPPAPSQSAPTADTTDKSPSHASDDPYTAVTMLLLDECLAAFIEEALGEVLLQRAMEVQEMPWNHSKMMFVGPGRAGKTGTMRSMLGQNDDVFEQTASTVGIDNDWSCEVVQETTLVDGNATFEQGDNRWISSMTSKQDKAKRNYESALAGVIAAIKQGRLQEAVQVATQAAQTAMDNTAAAAVAREQGLPSKPKDKEEPTSGGGGGGGGGVGDKEGKMIVLRLLGVVGVRSTSMHPHCCPIWKSNPKGHWTVIFSCVL